jgi:hypothetical protein
MLKMLFGLLLLGALAFAAATVPLRGRTVLARWNAARTPAEFVQRGWRETKVALGLEAEKKPPRQAARPPRPARPARPAQPTEGHTDQDRAALDRLLAEHARE